jgi:hypothetical protein
MADASRHTPPSNWGDAFAAVPLESPPASRWSAIDAALGGTDNVRASPERAPWPRRVAWAAVLAALALPAALWLRPGDVAPSRTPFATTSASPAPAAAVVAASPAAATSPAPAAIPVQTPPAPSTTLRTHAPAARIARVSTPVARDLRPAPQAKPWPRARIATHEDDASLQAAFEPYYAESARLERVIASTRDPRVGSGPAASLAGALDAELAAVDARLAQPDLDAGQRLALWHERVDVLRASAEFESQLRLLAVEGDVLDGALVRID